MSSWADSQDQRGNGQGGFARGGYVPPHLRGAGKGLTQVIGLLIVPTALRCHHQPAARMFLR